MPVIQVITNIIHGKNLNCSQPGRYPLPSNKGRQRPPVATVLPKDHGMVVESELVVGSAFFLPV